MFLWLIMFGAADQQVDAKQPLGLKLQLHEPHKDPSLILSTTAITFLLPIASIATRKRRLVPQTPQALIKHCHFDRSSSTRRIGEASLRNSAQPPR